MRGIAFGPSEFRTRLFFQEAGGAAVSYPLSARGPLTNGLSLT